MKGLKNFAIIILLVIVAFLFCTVVLWLLSDANYNYKMCVQSTGCYIIGAVLGLFANMAYFDIFNTELN